MKIAALILALLLSGCVWHNHYRNPSFEFVANREGPNGMQSQWRCCKCGRLVWDHLHVTEDMKRRCP